GRRDWTSGLRKISVVRNSTDQVEQMDRFHAALRGGRKVEAGSPEGAVVAVETEFPGTEDDPEDVGDDPAEEDEDTQRADARAAEYEAEEAEDELGGTVIAVSQVEVVHAEDTEEDTQEG